MQQIKLKYRLTDTGKKALETGTYEHFIVWVDLPILYYYCNPSKYSHYQYVEFPDRNYQPNITKLKHYGYLENND